MKIIISPAKKMNTDTDTFQICDLPEFMADTKTLMSKIRSLSLEDAKALWKCNDKLAELNYKRFQDMDLERVLTPAIMAYEGLQYQHMARGEMVRFMAENQICSLERIKEFQGMGFAYAKELSDQTTYVFAQEDTK